MKEKSRRIFNFFFRWRASLLLIAAVFFFPAGLQAAGITIPSGSTLDVNTGTLNVSGDVTIVGTLETSSGRVRLTGNWDNAAGTYTANTGAIEFNGTSGTQTLIPGGIGVGKFFYDLAHTGASTVLSGSALNIDHNFTNTAGIFNANAQNMTVAGDWSNSGTFSANSNSVVFDGTNQQFVGSTTFYNFSKVVSASDTLTFDTAGVQTITNSLTLQGAASQLLAIRSNNSGTRGNIALQSGGTQTISYLDVKDSDASGGVTLIAGSTSTDSGNNINWVFGAATIIWTGNTSTDWDVPTNWNLGLVPGTLDTAVIPDVIRQPILSTNVTIANLTVDVGATVELNGKNLTVSSILLNSGNVILFGNEAVSIGVVDADSGTFTFTGDGDGSAETFTLPDFGSGTDYYHVVINDTSGTQDTFQSNANVTIAGNLNVTSSTMNISTNANTLTVGGILTVNGGTLTATNGNIDANGTVVVSSGILTAPGSGKSFTVADDFTHSGGTFSNSSGTVTLDTTTTATISGDTTFYNLTSTTAGKQIQFSAGSTQTVSNVFNFAGGDGNPIILRSTTDGSKWDITVPGGAQIVSFLDVKDSDANTNTITCVNCTDSGNNNANWIFVNLRINVPISGKTVGQFPTVIGVGPVGQTVLIKDINNSTVATTIVDANGNFRVQVSTALALGANSLTPSIASPAISGPPVTLTVISSPSSVQVPTITSHANGQKVNGTTPTLSGQGKPGQSVTVLANDASGNMLLQTVGTGTVDSNGRYSVTLSTALLKGTNYLSVTIDNVASSILTVIISNPFGVVFDSETNELIEGAVVTLYTENSILARPGIELDASDVNPYTTTSDGAYGFLANAGNYFITVAAVGYQYPSAKTTFPTGRSVVVGSKQEVFSVGTTVSQIDHPIDLTRYLRIVKEANKSQARIGDIVTYTVTIENTSSFLTFNNVILEDKIPPGFKYIKDRVILDGSAIVEPTGQRPLRFSIGTMIPSGTKTLKYQLIIGSGVSIGNYENVAIAKNTSATILSNRTSATVKIILDPLFDMGTVIGKVFWDKNENGIQDEPQYYHRDQETVIESPIPNVSIVTEQGTVVRADQNGQFSLPSLPPGRHLLRLDERTLPESSYLTTDKVVIVDITPGILAKVNFGVQLEQEGLIAHEPSFFVEKMNLIQDKSKPKPRLNVSLFNSAAVVSAIETTSLKDMDHLTAQPFELSSSSSGEDEIILSRAPLNTPVEFRIFTNYSSFIDRWKIEILEQETKKLIQSFAGDQSMINSPIYWDGTDRSGQVIRVDRHYIYILTVTNPKNEKDETQEKPIKLVSAEDKKLDDHLQALEEWKEKVFSFGQANPEDILKKLESNQYRAWLQKQNKENALAKQTITVDGETMIFERLASDIRNIRVIKFAGSFEHLQKTFVEIPVIAHRGISAQDLVSGQAQVAAQSFDQFDVILPQGDYEIQVQQLDQNRVLAQREGVAPGAVSADKLTRAETAPASPGVSSPPLASQTYSKKVKVGEDYLFFVALGDAKVGYTVNRKQIESVSQDDQYKNGFWAQGKMSYFLKGKIKGKYLVTSSFDSNRQNQEIFKNLDPDQYYPIYGDSSSKDYSAADTQGMLYLLVQWDKSSAMWGNYNVGFSNTEFAQYNRSLYGGKVDYQSVASTQFGDPLTRVIVFRAIAKQRGAHNEFLGTGGSLYYFKHKEVIEGSDKVSIEVRDRITGLVLSKKEMKRNVDYEIDYSEGRMLFWKPVHYIVQGTSIISSDLLKGNLVYVVTDYEYEVKNKFEEGAQGARVEQAVSDYVKVGTTYIKESHDEGNYSLKGADTTLHLGKDATIVGEIARSISEASGTFISTDGGLTFTELATAQNAEGQAYGLKGDVRLFNRLGLSSYYKWIGQDFSTPATTSQQGKELTGLAATYDLTPNTRVTARQDIQSLLDNGNAQTQLQLGAQQTITTSLQVIHELRNLRLTYEYRHQEVKEKKDQIVSETNSKENIVASQAEYQLNDRVKLSLAHQESLSKDKNQQTTVGVTNQVTDKLALRANETFGNQGTATGIGGTYQATDKISVSGDYAIVNSHKSGQVGGVASMGTEYQVNEATQLQTSVGVTGTSTGDKITTMSVGGTSRVDDQTNINTTVGVTQSATSGRGTILGLQAQKQVDASSETTTGVSVSEKPGEGKSSTITFGTRKKLSDELKLISDRSFGSTPSGITQGSAYGLIREKDGTRLEGTLNRQYAQSSSGITGSNILGLKGDINDRFSAIGSFEKGQVQNLDASSTDRQAMSLGLGYVQKDEETHQEVLKASSKVELRQDSGVQDTHQYLVDTAIQGKINPQTSLYAKAQFSKTTNTTANAVQARYKEMVIGGAYRPLSSDRLNLLARYTYLTGQKPGGQISSSDVEQARAHVLSVEAVYDLDDHWQLSEKLAYRMGEEKVQGFDFTRTQTWLMIHRLNYNIAQDWKVGAEYRVLTQVQAQDQKRGFLVEATRKMTDMAQLGVGYNFTQFSDDLTDLAFNAQGPFIRVTAGLYDRTPQEITRAKQRRLEKNISAWAWSMVRDELARPTSPIVQDLNDFLIMAQAAKDLGQYAESQKIYKDIIVTAEMMYQEAVEYIRGRISAEETLKNLYDQAQEYFKKGQFEEAKKLWEKILEDAKRGMVE